MPRGFRADAEHAGGVAFVHDPRCFHWKALDQRHLREFQVFRGVAHGADLQLQSRDIDLQAFVESGARHHVLQDA